MKTIEEFNHATKEEIEEAVKYVTVEEDLYTYLSWLNSSKGCTTEGRFKVGHDPHRAVSFGFHPSALAKVAGCKLKLYFDVTGEVQQENKFDIDMQMTFDIGTCLHSLLQTHFLNMYDDQFEEEVWLRNKRLLINSAHTDGRFNFDNVRFLLEIKSIKEGGNYGWEKIQDKPFPDNVRQVMTYMFLDNCPFGLILYICKNNGKIKEHPIQWDQKLWNEIQTETIQPVMDAIKAKKKPNPTTGYHCRTCEYLHGCESGKEHKNGKRAQRRRSIPTRDGVGHFRNR
jgi:hypothetical protein